MSTPVMHRRSLLLLALAASVAVPSTACNMPASRSNERWVTTKNTKVDIDWDAVGKAYKSAEGPEDFERRVNEIYRGDELVSIAVEDEGDARQVVTGFFDKNEDGTAAADEKIFSITRDITGEGAGQFQMAGHGMYSHYRSPVWDLAAGMMLGSMISRAFSPGYRPMYTRPYVTSPARRTQLRASRASYRKANPAAFSRKGSASKSGRRYGRSARGFGGGRAPRPRPRMRMGGRFGAPAHTRPRVRLAL